MSNTAPPGESEHHCLDCDVALSKGQFGPFPLRCPACRLELKRHRDRTHQYRREGPEAHAANNEYQRRYRRERYARDPGFRQRVLDATSRWKIRKAAGR